MGGFRTFIPFILPHKRAFSASPQLAYCCLLDAASGTWCTCCILSHRPFYDNSVVVCLFSFVVLLLPELWGATTSTNYFVRGLIFTLISAHNILPNTVLRIVVIL